MPGVSKITWQHLQSPVFLITGNPLIYYLCIHLFVRNHFLYFTYCYFYSCAMMLRRIIFIRLFLLVFIPLTGMDHPVYGQQDKDYLTLSGLIEEGNEPLADAVIRVFVNGQPVETKKSDGSGNFEVKMDLGQQYIIEFSKQGYVAKKVEVNSAVPQGQGGTWKVEFSIGLFQDYPGLDVSALQDPVTRIHYKTGERGFGYDERYTRKMMSRINDILAQRRRLVEEAYQQIIDKADRLFEGEDYRQSIEVYQQALDKRPDERYPEKRIEKARELMQQMQRKQELYEEAIRRGDQFFHDKDFDNSRQAYRQALEHQPSRGYPKQQISKIDRLVKENRQRAQERQAQYEQLVKEADRLFDEDQLAKARDKYKQALNVKPGQEHPERQLERIAEMIRERQQRKQRYENLILQGDRAFAANSYDQARDSYKEAAAMEMGDPYPRDQLRKIDSILNAQQQKRKRYQQYIEQGDQAFNDESWSQAKEAYTQALAIWPGESYPSDQIRKIDQILSRRRMKQQKYEAAVKEADRYFEAEKYIMARDAYQQALEIKPGQSYPDRQMDKIEEILARRKAQDRRYEALIQSADEAFNKQQYEASREDYRQALKIKPQREYPKQQLDLIRQRLAKAEQKEQARKNYQDKIRQADQAFNNETYPKAKDLYEQAVQMRPHEEYPQDQIARIDEIRSRQMKARARKKASEEAYRQTIEQADALFSKEAYEDARTLYEKALDIKPNQEHPQQRIARIDEILSQRRSRNNNFKAAVEKGDRLFDEQQYQQAVSAYQKALEIKSGAPYPTSQIQKIRNLLANRQTRKERQQALEQKYSELISKADGRFNQEEYQVARKTYSQAAQIKPEEPYPPRKIQEIDSIFDRRREARQQAYRQAVNKADALFEEKKYDGAVDQYSKAQEIKPEEEYPPRQISRINNLLAQMKRDKRKQERLDSLYASTIDRADAYFGRHNYYNAKAYYEKALKFKPEEAYPQRKIQVCIRKIREFEQARAQSREEHENDDGSQAGPGRLQDELSGHADTSTIQHTYLSELARKYPEGVTREQYEKDNRKITRVIVNYDGVADEYHKVQHSWGAVFYFRNGRPVSKEVFHLETRERNP